MAAAGKLRYAYLAFLSKPREDRQLYRLAKQLRATSIVELGVESLQRSLNLISVCQRYSPEATVSYTGLDWFEERPTDAEPLSLKEAHRQIKAAGAQTRLMPGGPAMALPAVANSLLGTDLVLISPAADDAFLADAWFYVPRILKQQSVVLRGLSGVNEATCWSEIPHSEIDALAAATRTATAA